VPPQAGKPFVVTGADLVQYTKADMRTPIFLAATAVYFANFSPGHTARRGIVGNADH